jgi:ADP-ribose pyrophosphatase YjhB (NUDIX family)/catechol 2,3-dioxygenase-like lactoylglutathione lyase family enzyme
MSSGVQRVGAYCVIYDAEGRMLLTQLSERIRAGDWWTLPGGGIDFGEHPEHAAVREVKEETNLDVVLGRLVMADSQSRLDDADPTQHFHALRYIYEATALRGEVCVLDIGGSTTAAGWFTADELAEMNLVDLVQVARLQCQPNPSRLRRLDHVQLAIPTGGEDRAREFWVGLLGLIEQPKPPVMAARGGAWFSSPDGAVTVHVGVAPKEVGAQKSHPAFIVEDLAAVAEILSTRGYPVRWDTDNPGIRRFHTNDPFGNRIELIA